ncbi:MULTISPECIES: DUF397 domain-containing protein [Nocardia]|uniref:DUF397 domain-containing protein n=1 Tax=Nocardia TaxID=1817 RepID=UPI001894701B|nr:MULTISPECIES: DUF397 domain-containing protein [Nocardia]MBF6216227.1 DUF397 domain-containing protein [Nocardia puris]MBF6574098.1 DUF397 domain-containing protein [Nocardia farcinica]
MTTQQPLDGYVKSSYSDGGGQCVEVRRYLGQPEIHIRDSKFRRDPRNRHRREPIICMPATAWPSFEDAVLGRRVDSPALGQPDVEQHPDHGVTLRDANGTTLTFTPEEWTAFVLGLRAGEFAPRTAA